MPEHGKRQPITRTCLILPDNLRNPTLPLPSIMPPVNLLNYLAALAFSSPTAIALAIMGLVVLELSIVVLCTTLVSLYQIKFYRY